MSRARLRIGSLVAGLAVVGAGLVVAMLGAVRGIERWSADRALDDATRSLAAGDAHAAARTLLPVVAQRPGDAVTHYYLGLAYIRSGLPSAAIAQLSEAERLQPADARVRGALGQAYRAVGTPALALHEFLDAVALDPRDPAYRAEAANVLLDDGRVDEALTQLREAVRLRPTASDVRVLLGLALCRAGDAAGMRREYRTAERIAAGEPLGEVAHGLAEARGPLCATTTLDAVHP
jgi:Flp pilus assembly protein TadD